jgi:hypothetical protein
VVSSNSTFTANIRSARSASVSATRGVYSARSLIRTIRPGKWRDGRPSSVPVAGCPTDSRGSASCET